MRLTPALSVRKLLARFQPPFPPQSPRESKQLLNVLESAFQKHLDDAHPSPRAVETKDVVRGRDWIPEPAQRLTHSTHSHLDSILSHPLLKRRSTSFVPPHSLSATAVATFDAALTGKGLDRHLVQFCTLQYLEGLEKKEKIPEDGRLGPRLANWFTTMDEPEKKEFWINNKSLKPLVSVMYADGLEAEVWQWLQALYERQFSSNTCPGASDVPDAGVYLLAEDRLVAAMISETIARGSLQEAAELYVQACNYRHANGQTGRPLKWAWQRLSMAVLGRRKNHGIPAGLYEGLLANGLSVHSSGVDHTFVRLYHPTSPLATMLCSKLQATSLGDFSEWQRKSSFKKSARKVFLVNLLDAAQISLDQNRPADARFILDCAEREYPDFLSSQKETNTKKRLELAQAAMLVRRLEGRRLLQSSSLPIAA